MNITQWLEKTQPKVKTYSTDYSCQDLRQHLVCKDGFKMSVQASETHYCTPRHNGLGGNYSAVEIGFPNRKEPRLMEWAEDRKKPTKTVYGYVPVGVVDEIIQAHGGIKE